MSKTNDIVNNVKDNKINKIDDVKDNKTNDNKIDDNKMNAINNIINTLAQMDLYTLHILTEKISEKFNINASININNNNNTANADIDESKDNDTSKDEKKEVSIILSPINNPDSLNKLAILKIIKNITGLNFIESKKFFDEALGGKAQVLKKNISLEQANEYKKQFNDSGIEVKIE